jgi:hypothetical protein
MVSDNLQELHNYAAEIGLKRCWFQTARKHPHYDVLSSTLIATIRQHAKTGRVKLIKNTFSGQKVILQISKASRKRRN